MRSRKERTAPRPVYPASAPLFAKKSTDPDASAIGERSGYLSQALLSCSRTVHRLGNARAEVCKRILIDREPGPVGAFSVEDRPRFAQ